MPGSFGAGVERTSVGLDRFYHSAGAQSQLSGRLRVPRPRSDRGSPLSRSIGARTAWGTNRAGGTRARGPGGSSTAHRRVLQWTRLGFLRGPFPAEPSCWRRGEPIAALRLLMSHEPDDAVQSSRLSGGLMRAFFEAFYFNTCHVLSRLNI